MNMIIRNGYVVDPASRTEGIADVEIRGGKVYRIAAHIESEGGESIDAEGCYVLPGLIDMHVHLRDPGYLHKETIETGAKAAAKGGFTTIVAMGNTNPAADNADTVRYVQKKAKETAPIHVLPVATVTKEMAGKELTDIEGLCAAGAAALSEDGKTVMDAGVFRQAMKQAAKCGLVILDHCEDENLKGDGVMHDDERVRRLGLKGISNAVEDTIIARDILLAKETGASLHICHCSTEDSVPMIAWAKKQGVHVSAEVCPHHFTLTTRDIKAGDSNYKMAPPLRAEKDVAALKKGLQEGIIDVIATDHAPHAEAEKRSDLNRAAFGIVGLETAVSLTLSELVLPGVLTWMQMAECMSYKPAQILGIDKGSITPGKAADLVIIHPGETYKINKEEFVSMGRNTPFHGREVTGRVKATICGGKIVYRDLGKSNKK